MPPDLMTFCPGLTNLGLSNLRSFFLSSFLTSLVPFKGTLQNATFVIQIKACPAVTCSIQLKMRTNPLFLFLVTFKFGVQIFLFGFTPPSDRSRGALNVGNLGKSTTVVMVVVVDVFSSGLDILHAKTRCRHYIQKKYRTPHFSTLTRFPHKNSQVLQ